MNKERGLTLANESGAEQNLQEIEEIKFLPAELRLAFSRLPESVRSFILQRFEDLKEINEEVAKNPEEGPASLDEKERFDYLEVLLSHLFLELELDRTADLTSDDLVQKIAELMDTLWSNRGQEEVKIFNQKFYDEFFQKRQKFVEELKKKQQEVEAIKEPANLKSKSKRRDFEIWRGRQWEEVRRLKKNLEKFDQENGNTVFNTRTPGSVPGAGRIYNAEKNNWLAVEGRKNREEALTKKIGQLAEYLTADEFTVGFADYLDTHFSLEKDLVIQTRIQPKELPILFGRPVSKERLEEMKELITGLNLATSGWHQAHETEGRLKEPIATEKKFKKTPRRYQFLPSAETDSRYKNIKRVISHFYALYDSFSRSFERGEEKSASKVAVADMKICLNILNKNQDFFEKNLIEGR